MSRSDAGSRGVRRGHRAERYRALARLARPVVLLALLACAACAPGLFRPPEPLPVRVLVYNIHAGKDAALVHNLERVAEVVRESGADLVLLQEVDRNTERSGREDQLAALSRLTGLEGAFGRAIDHQGGEYGVAVLSRWPIEADSMYALPVAHADPAAAATYEGRGMLHLVVRSPRGAINVLNTHLDATRTDEYRLQQIAGVRSLAGALRARGEPVLVGGDFNALPESPVVVGMLAEEWRDAWTACGVGPPGTFPEDAPSRRIDYLFLPPWIGCSAARVIDTRASDHRPLLVVVELPG